MWVLGPPVGLGGTKQPPGAAPWLAGSHQAVGVLLQTGQNITMQLHCTNCVQEKCGGQSMWALRCSGGRCGGRPGCSGRWSSLHTRATAANGGGAFTRAGRVSGARWAAATAHGSAERRPSGYVACVWHACADLGARSGAREAPSVSEADSGGLGPAWRCPTVPLEWAEAPGTQGGARCGRSYMHTGISAE